MAMSDGMYERTVKRVLTGRDDDEVEATKLEPIEQWGARQCARHAEMIKTQERTIQTLERVIESLRARLAERETER